MIIKRKSGYLLKSKNGKKTLGKHPTKKAALKQEKAINIQKAKKNKKVYV